ncbi:MAG: hypothetical protein SFU83_19205 [Meiothermus sp.]|nr:hypothetical protein [Meiothermus sp.]
MFALMLAQFVYMQWYIYLIALQQVTGVGVGFWILFIGLLEVVAFVIWDTSQAIRLEVDRQKMVSAP